MNVASTRSRAVPRRIFGLAGLITVTSLGVGCGDQGRRSARSDSLQGVVLIVLDTLRPDHLGCYGYERPTSPNIDRVAAEGVRFEQAVSFAPWTLPSMASLLSGRGAPRVYDGTLRASIVEQLADAGVKTAAITEGGFVSRRFGMDLGFELFVEEEGAVRLNETGQAAKGAGSGGIATTFARAQEWVSEHVDTRFFLLIHTYEPHTPYNRHHFTAGLAPGRVGRNLRIGQLPALRSGDLRFGPADLEYVTALYDGGVLESDRHVGEFDRFLDELGVADNVAVVITSDHGEELGHHYPRRIGDHGHSVYGNLVDIPLIIRDPSESKRKAVVSTLVRSLDVLPTIADLLGVPIDSGVEGRSLRGLMRGDAEEPRFAFGGANKAGPAQLFVQFLGYKYIQNVGGATDPVVPPPPARQLFDLGADPFELRNIVDERPDLVEKFEQLLRGVNAAELPTDSVGIPEGLDEEMQERLRSLGYVK